MNIVVGFTLSIATFQFKINLSAASFPAEHFKRNFKILCKGRRDLAHAKKIL